MEPVQAYQLVYNLMSLSIAAMGSSFFFFVSARSALKPENRMAVTLSATVVLIALYHYVRIFNSWVDTAGGTLGTFNEAYRYVDWILTVPLLLVEVVAVLALAKDVAKSLMTRLVIASSAMIILGYPGEVSSSTGTKMLWFVLSMIPFIYILYVLFVELTKSLDRQPEGVAGKIGNLRTLLVVTWMVYPISYLIPVFVADPSASQAASLFTYRQVGYTLADVLAKCLFGLVVFNIARTKSAAEGMNESH